MASAIGIVLLICLSNLIKDATAYSSGAPDSVCETMKPGHFGTSSQDSAVPFELSPGGQTVKAGDMLTLTLKKTGVDDFKGFMVQALDTATNQSIGSFILETSEYVLIDYA